MFECKREEALQEKLPPYFSQNIRKNELNDPCSMHRIGGNYNQNVN
jgi:hypothetical protein